MRNIIVILCIGFIHLAGAQSNNNFYPIKDRKTGCIFFSIQQNIEIEWNGNCENGYLKGDGQLNIFSNNKLVYISKCTMKEGNINGEFFDTSLVGKYSGQGRKINGLLNGPIIQKFYDGQIKSRVTEYKMDVLDGKQTVFINCDTCMKEYLYKVERHFKNGKLIAKDNYYQYISDGKIIIQTVDERGTLLPVPVTLIKPEGYKVNGIFSQEKMQFIGDVNIEWENGAKYTGEYANNNPNGQGTYTFTDGSKYIGGWKDGESGGQGTLTFSDGEKYFGEWNNGKKNGRGTLTYSDGRKYVGEWKGNKMEGQGAYAFPNGEKYVGGFLEGYYHGQGTYTFTDGRKYSGEWNRGKMEGQGIYLYPDGSKYSGGYLDDNYHGLGTYTKSDGSKYVGEWKNDKKDGQGTMTFPPSSKYKIYEGGWREDNLSGSGVLTMSDGTKIPFRDGNPIDESYNTNANTANRLIDGLGIRDQWEKAMNQVRASMGGGKFNIKDCMYCSGSGTVKICPICRQLGRVNCKECQGRGYRVGGRVCVDCSGTGIVKCNSCQGKIYNIKCTHNIFQFQK